jgi:hypothetical protein
MRTFRPLMILTLAALALCAACTPQAPATTTTPTDEFACPHPGPSTVIVAGDSLNTHWPRYTALPDGTNVITIARGAAAYTNPRSGDFSTSISISERLLAELDLCGNDVGAVIVGGGVNDLSRGLGSAPLISAVSDLDTELASRGVRVIWQPITPWAVSSSLFWDVRYEQRLEYNTWLTTPGNVTGGVVDCNQALADPRSAVEVMNPAYHTWADLFTQDRYHPNMDGYAMYAACLSPHITSAIAVQAPVPAS